MPLLYLHGLSSSDFGPALEQFLGSVPGLSAATVTRLTADCQTEATAFSKSPLKDTDFVYVWVDGIHLKVRLEQDKMCLLVMVGVRADGTKDLVALEDGTMNPPSRGQTREQRYWFHKIANVLCALPKTASPARRPHSPRSGNAEDREHAEKAARAFVAGCGRSGPRHREDHRRPRRAARLLRLPGRALDPPAHHQPIESTFATVRLRQRVTKGPGSRAAGIAMAFKLIGSAQARWRAVNAPLMAALVHAGAEFENGQHVERPDESRRSASRVTSGGHETGRHVGQRDFRSGSAA